VVALLAGCGGGSDDVPPPSPALGTPVDFALSPQIANLPLTKPDGTTTSLADYRGKSVMIADFMTECTDICPMITANTVAVARALADRGLGDDVALLEVSIDPKRDTLRRMTAYQKLFRPPVPNWTLLRASAKDTPRFWRYFGVQLKRVTIDEEPPDRDWLTGKPLTYDVEHSDLLIFLDAGGHVRFVVNASPDARGQTLPAKLSRVLGEQGEELLHHPDPVTSWTVRQGLSVFGWLLNRDLAPSD
jgi:protein SCO1/2